MKKDEKIGFLPVNEVAQGFKSRFEDRSENSWRNRGVLLGAVIVDDLKKIYIDSQGGEILLQIYKIGLEKPVKKELHERPIGNEPLHELLVPEH